MKLQDRMLSALGDGPGIFAGDLLLCRGAVLSGEAARDGCVRLEVRDGDRWGDGDPIQPATAEEIVEGGMFCALHAGCEIDHLSG